MGCTFHEQIILEAQLFFLVFLCWWSVGFGGRHVPRLIPLLQCAFLCFPFFVSVQVSVILQLTYITKFFHWEMGYMNSMDIQHDRAGFYLCWGCLVSRGIALNSKARCGVNTTAQKHDIWHASRTREMSREMSGRKYAKKNERRGQSVHLRRARKEVRRRSRFQSFRRHFAASTPLPPSVSVSHLRFGSRLCTPPPASTW